MKKVIFIIVIVFLIFSALLTGTIIYLNNVYLPKTIKALVIKTIEDNTGSKVTLGSVRVNMFKGLVLTNLDIYKNESAVIKVKEASCIFLPFPIFRKQIIIPIINIKSAQVFLERKKDNTLNLEDLVLPVAVSAPVVSVPNPGVAANKSNTASSRDFSFSVYRVNISNARINFQDSTFSPPFVKSVESLNAVISLSLPSSVKFKLSAVISATQPVKFGAYGEFKVPTQELSARLDLQNLFPADFSVYYQAAGLGITDGLINLSGDLKIKDNALYADIQAKANNLNILLKGFGVKSNIDLNAVMEYAFGTGELKYYGNSKIYDTEISGVEFVDKISAVNCSLEFGNDGLSTQDLNALVLNFPVKAKLIIKGFSDPELSLSAITSLSLVQLQGVIKDKFKFDPPATFDGQGKVSLKVEGKLSALTPNIDIELIDASAKLKNIDSPIQEINGKIDFIKNRLHWEAVKLKYQGALYETSGSLIDFKSPILDISLRSEDLSLASVLNFNDKLITVSKFSGTYLNSKFSASGSIDTAYSGPKVDLAGELLVDLKDLKKPFSNKFKDQLDKINADGLARIEFNFSGLANDLKNCSSVVRASSEGISLYGLKSKALLLNYTQGSGIADVSSMHLDLYGGSIDGYFTVNLKAKNNPYVFKVIIRDVKIEELKADTSFKAKDIAGIIQAEANVNGLLGDLPGSQGAGKVKITKGKLWELDLFKGLGKILFSQDLANITFYEGTCDFDIQDKSISTENLLLKSTMVELSGPVRIGFDNSISAKLDVNILDEFVPLSGTFKDVTTAIIGQAGRFAVIKVSGTLKEPKYKFQTAVTDIIKGLADTFLKGK